MKTNLAGWLIAFACILGGGSVAQAQDGVDIGSGLPSLFIQDTATGFGNALGGGQDSAGGSEINQVFGSYNPSTGILNVGITGNLEGNFNKLYLFFDATAGGENVLDSTNTDGGFNEIQTLSGLTFDSGFTADHGLRFEVGDTFYGVNGFNLIDDSNFAVTSGSGFGDLPLASVGSNGVTLGWDNSNVAGVTDVTAADAATATTGIELAIDTSVFFDGALQQEIGIAGFITSADATFLSNQVIGGLGAGAANLGGPGAVDFGTIAGNQFVTVTAIPEPSAAALIGVGAAVLAWRQRRRRQV